MEKRPGEKAQSEELLIPVVRILIVEDDPIDAKWAEKALMLRRDVQCRVETVDLLSKAKEALSKKPFEVIILDLDIPDANGIELFNAIKKFSRDAAVLIMTGTPEEYRFVENILHLGAQDYVIKGETTAEEFVRSVMYAKERNRLIYELEQKNRTLEGFSSMVSHDLKQPLTAIKTAIVNIDNPAAKKESRETIKSRCDDMARTIDTLLSYASVGRKIEKKEKIGLSVCVQDAIANLKIIIATAGAKIKLNPLPTVLVNRDLMKLVFQNLILNAIKFRRPKLNPRIVISSNEKEGFWIISVKDNGKGVAREYQNNVKIFLPFQGKGFGKVSKYGGYGIGLSTSKMIVESHGGQIWFETQLGKGTTFYFSIPK
ncbi:MAG: hypothetical protein A3F16_05965 [Deltaproteobacteria bacterium RIFCSPHIGHO2_12_FULL_43_9]|nr:MAG: hypothetical protein A3F16_05965 [Deltaproteobacteria bacterium RIFCSPHIGHO2_12_FULL_43_9]